MTNQTYLRVGYDKFLSAHDSNSVSRSGSVSWGVSRSISWGNVLRRSKSCSMDGRGLQLSVSFSRSRNGRKSGSG
jgi:hypothetical protein